MDPIIRNRCVVGAKAVKIPAKSENIPRIDQRPTSDPSQHQILDLAGNLCRSLELPSPQKLIPNRQQTIDATKDPRRGYLDIVGLLLGRIGTAHPCKDPRDLNPLDLGGSQSTERRIELLPCSPQRLPANLRFSLQTLAMNPFQLG